MLCSRPSKTEYPHRLVPHPRVFLSKSAQSHEKKRVVIFTGAKKNKKKGKRVRKNVKRKGIGGRRQGTVVQKSRHPPTPPPICMNIKRKDLRNAHFINDRFQRTCFWLSRACIGKQGSPEKRKAEARLPHSKRSYLRHQL